MWLFCLHICLSTTRTPGIGEDSRRSCIGWPETGVTGNCELPQGVLGIKPGSCKRTAGTYDDQTISPCLSY